MERVKGRLIVVFARAGFGVWLHENAEWFNRSWMVRVKSPISEENSWLCGSLLPLLGALSV